MSLIVLRKILSVFTDKENQPQRVAFSCAASNLRAEFGLELGHAIKAVGVDREEIDGDLSILLGLRLLWRLVPTDLLVLAEPNYEAMAASALQKEFKRTDDILARKLSIIFRRLRSSYVRGRDVSSLDPSNTKHRKLLVQQHNACAVCLISFPRYPLRAIEEEELSYFVKEYHPLAGEEVLDTYYNKPVLDHVIPYYLGGDGDENWQVLCHSCNSGKGEALSWITRRGWMPPQRLADVQHLTASLRYSCLASFDASEFDPSEDKCLRIFRKDPTRLVTFDNLAVAYA